MWLIIGFHEGFDEANSLAVEFHPWFLSNVQDSQSWHFPTLRT